MSRESMSACNGEHFVGRARELELLRQHANGDTAWRWVHIYGKSGIGKSSLIKQFMDQYSDRLFYFMDGGEELKSLCADSPISVASSINQRSRDLGGRMTIIIDEFDQWHSIVHWFMQWLGSLDVSIRMVTVGRHLLTGRWLRSPWNGHMHMMHLQELSYYEVAGYAAGCGITEQASQVELYRFSRGIPLAMVLAATTTLSGQTLRPMARSEHFQLISTLMSDMLQGQPAFVPRMLEAAALYWRFNEERLAAIMEHDSNNEAESFRRFVQLPFVLLKEDGWMLHDAIRAWVLDDFMLRKPNLYERMRVKALNYIYEEEQFLLKSQKNKQSPLDKLFLHEHPLVRALCSNGLEDELEIRPCYKNDLPAIRDLYKRSHSHAAGSVEDTPLLIDRINELWECIPSAFVTIWWDQRLVGFFVKIPLNDRQLEPILLHEPILSSFINKSVSMSEAYLMAVIGIEPDLEWKYRAGMISTLLSHYCSPEWIVALTSWSEWFPVFELCGFERAAWADAVSERGIDYQAFVLDLREEDFITKLDRTVQHARDILMPQTSVETFEKFDMKQLKAILNQWAVLPYRQALLQDYERLFPSRAETTRTAGMTGLANSADKEIRDAKEEIYQAIRRLSEGNEQEERLGKLLSVTYIEGVRPLEIAAKQLHMSTATYYRQLIRALHELYQRLSHG